MLSRKSSFTGSARCSASRSLGKTMCERETHARHAQRSPTEQPQRQLVARRVAAGGIY